MREVSADVLIIGAGPGGIAAACSAAESGQSVLVVDDNPHPGGQIWRHDVRNGLPAAARKWLQRADEYGVKWQDGTTTSLPYRDLRIACHCAECIDEMTGVQTLDPATVPADIGVTECEEMGLYGVKIVWSTGHRTGIFSWERLRELGEVDS